MRLLRRSRISGQRPFSSGWLRLLLGFESVLPILVGLDHGTTPKAAQTQPATKTAQRAEKTNPTISIMGCAFNHALIRAVVTSQANCNAVKLTPKKAKPTISKPVMDASLKGLFACPQNRGNSLSALCRASQNCRLSLGKQGAIDDGGAPCPVIAVLGPLTPHTLPFHPLRPACHLGTMKAHHVL
jgi:hypothetical protein